jgi:Purple acid Phosphatase, N-terminal domain
MIRLFKIATVLLFCACVTATLGSGPVANAQSPQVHRVMLEFADANQAKIAWTSRHGEDLVLEYSPRPDHFRRAVDAVERQGGDNHRATLNDLRPHTTYYVRMADKSGRPVGPSFSFTTPGRHEPAIHEQQLGPAN